MALRSFKPVDSSERFGLESLGELRQAGNPDSDSRREQSHQNRHRCGGRKINYTHCRTSVRHFTYKEGWLPTVTLASWGLSGQWKMAVATLEQAGEPAQNALVSTQPFAELSPQQLTEIVMAPYTMNHPVGSGPLPAIHLCQLVRGLAVPSNLDAGCGAHTLLNATTVWLAYPTTDHANQNRYQQFFINPDQPAANPVWLSFERLNWLWMKRGALDTPHIQEN